MLNLFNTIAKHGSPGDKIQILRSFPYQEQLKDVLRLATDPFITFGITSVDGEPQALGDPYHALSLLAKRELTGLRARVTLGEACSDKEEQELMTRIINKDLRCGLGEKLVLQAYPGLIRQFEVMRAKKFDGAKTRTEYAVEPKYDGLRCVAIVEKGAVNLLSRNGNPFTSSDHLKAHLLELAKKSGGDCVFDGELISGNFNESSSAVRRKSESNDSTRYFIFDHLSMDEWRKPISPYYQRRNRLEGLFQGYSGAELQLVPSYRESNEDAILSLYQQFLDCGYEGAIVKNVKGLYRFSKHRDWLKLKEVNDVDLPVLELIQGEGKYYGMLGAVVVSFKGKRVNVGAGWSDEERDLYWKEPHRIRGKVIEIHYHQITPDGSLRHPRFHCIRDDKG